MNDFEYEVGLIKNPIIKKIAEEGISLLPKYFFAVPASSTGKYHPKYALGDGGLYRHVRAAVGIAVELFTIHDFTADERDIIITSLLLHDGWKQGLNDENSPGHSVHNHPVLASETLRNNIHPDSLDGEKFLELICGCISAHMGQWAVSKWDATVLPTPQDKLQKYVHMADYLASRKTIEYNFEEKPLYR